MRYLCNVDDQKLYAYAKAPRVLLASDDTLRHRVARLAAEGRHRREVAAPSRRHVYDAQMQEPLYFETSEPPE